MSVKHPYDAAFKAASSYGPDEHASFADLLQQTIAEGSDFDRVLSQRPPARGHAGEKGQGI